MNTILIPIQLRKVLGNQESLTLELTSIADLLSQISTRYPEARGRLINEETGEVNKFVNFYVNGEDIRFLNFSNTVVKDGDEISIVPALAGG